MPNTKVKKSKPSIMKQVVNVNIHNPKRKAKRVKSKPKTKSSNLYPAQLQSHNSGVMLPFHHQFYIPPTDKSMPQVEELTNKFRDGNLLQITQNNDLLKQLEGSHKLINQLAQQSIKDKSPTKLYEQLMQEHINRQNRKTISHIDDNGEMWDEYVDKNQPSSPTRKKINKILKEAIGQSPVIPAKRGRPKKVVLAQTPVQPLGEALPSAPALIPKARGRPTLTEEQKASNKADRLAKQNSGAGAGVAEFKGEEDKTIKAKEVLLKGFKKYSKKLKETNDRLKSGLGFEDFDTEPSSAIGAPVQAEAKGKTKPSPVAKRTRQRKK